jgi:hypothetical protein
MAALHSRVERKVHRDERVRALSHAGPNARELWMYLLTCDSQTSFPGLYVLRVSTVADDLDWPVAETRAVLDEIVASGMAKFDPLTSVLWLPNAIAKRADEALSDKTAKGWRNAWDGMPRCDLVAVAFHAACESIKALGLDLGKDVSKALSAFIARRPTWIEGASAVLLPSQEAPSKPHRSPIDAERGEEEERKRRGSPTAPARIPTRDETAVREAVAADDQFAGADIDATAERIGKRLAALAPEHRWPDLGAEVAGWIAHVRKESASARDAGKHWSAERAITELESKALSRIRYRPADAATERQRRRTLSGGSKQFSNDTDTAHEVAEMERVERDNAKRRGGTSSIADLMPTGSRKS